MSRAGGLDQRCVVWHLDVAATTSAGDDGNLSGFTVIFSCCCGCLDDTGPSSSYASDVHLISFIFYLESSPQWTSHARRTENMELLADFPLHFCPRFLSHF